MDGQSALQPRAVQTAAPIAENPPENSYVWARNDGRRMATDPDLYRKGQADQARCRESATVAGALNFPAFSSCMEAAGYNRRSV